jgi:UDP-N-acetylglucosamine--N-acetylmuramyl-(pentapeptide) pyrophosphoryl-undecaprenol N-acetylglucosamine transferase
MAVAEVLREKHPSKDLHLYYFGPEKYNEDYLKKNEVHFVYIPAGKNRIYASLENYFDFLKIFQGIFWSLIKLPIYYPDIIFSKGGYTAYPVLFAARILRIPVVEHDSDTVPGRVSLKFAKYARLIACGWSEGGKYFVNNAHVKEEKIMDTGVPTRRILNPMYKKEQQEQQFKMIDKSYPLISILGGSQGSVIVNEAIVAALPQLLPFAQVIHQTGKTDFENISRETKLLLEKMEEKKNYICKDFFNEKELREIYENSTLIVMRAGSQLQEAWMWGVPTILIPIREEISRDQTSNAFASMRRGASIVLEEKNLTPHIIQNEIIRLLQDNKGLARMSASARESAKYDASEKISAILLKYCKSHE